MSEKRYIKVDKHGETLIVDTWLHMAIEPEFAAIWLNCEYKDRMDAENTIKELVRDVVALRTQGLRTARTIVDLRQRRRAAA